MGYADMGWHGGQVVYHESCRVCPVGALSSMRVIELECDDQCSYMLLIFLTTFTPPSVPEGIILQIATLNCP